MLRRLISDRIIIIIIIITGKGKKKGRCKGQSTVKSKGKGKDSPIHSIRALGPQLIQISIGSQSAWRVTVINALLSARPAVTSPITLLRRGLVLHFPVLHFSAHLTHWVTEQHSSAVNDMTCRPI